MRSCADPCFDGGGQGRGTAELAGAHHLETLRRGEPGCGRQAHVVSSPASVISKRCRAYPGGNRCAAAITFALPTQLRADPECIPGVVRFFWNRFDSLLLRHQHDVLREVGSKVDIE